jgi:hypothetical protein
MKKLFFAGALLCISINLLAAEPPSRGFYLGGTAGITELDDDNFASNQGLSLDDSDSSFGIYGGYKILKYLAVEGRLIDLGSYTVSNGFASEDVDLGVFSAHVVGIVPFGTSGWEIFGQLGLGRINIDFAGDDDDETVGSAGIGVRWYPIPHLGLSLQIDAWAWEEDEGFSTYDFAVGSTQFAIHYLF